MSKIDKFSNIVGHKDLINFIKRVIDEDSVPKSLILYGEPGVGKTSLARLTVMSMLCPYSKHGECCSECVVCRKIISNQHEDIIELDAALKSSLEDIKPLLELAQYKPKFSSKRVIIIDECQRLSQQAFSSMFKTLEESPTCNHFIFVTTNINKIPESVLSRSIKLALRAPSYDELNEFLDKLSQNQLNATWKRILIEYSWSKPRDLINAYKISRFIDNTNDLLKLLGHPSNNNLNDFWISVNSNHLPIVRYLVENFKRDIPDQNHLLNCLIRFLFNSNKWLRLRERVIEKLIHLSSLHFLQDNMILDLWVSLMVTSQKDLEYRLLREIALSKKKDLFERVYQVRYKLICETPNKVKVLGDKYLSLEINKFLKRR